MNREMREGRGDMRRMGKEMGSNSCVGGCSLAS